MPIAATSPCSSAAAAGEGSGSSSTRAGPGEAIDPDAHDLFYMGGGQDRDQALVARDLVDTKREALEAAVAGGAAVLAVCGGYQLLGRSYALSETESLPGLGLVDLETVREPGPRLIGNVVIEVDLGGGPRRLAGFENHGGRTYLGEGEQPLGQGRLGLRQQRPRRLRGRAAREADRHLPPWPAAAEERLARGSPDRVGAGAAARPDASSSSRSTTSSSGVRTSARSAWRSRASLPAHYRLQRRTSECQTLPRSSPEWSYTHSSHLPDLYATAHRYSRAPSWQLTLCTAFRASARRRT